MGFLFCNICNKVQNVIDYDNILSGGIYINILQIIKLMNLKWLVCFMQQ